jgi:hypothetical protein
MRVERPRSFVIPSSREAVSTVSPWTVCSSRRAEPSRRCRYERPAVEADPHPEAIAEAAIARQRLKRGRRTSSISRAAATARSVWSATRSGPRDCEHAVAAIADQRAAVRKDRVDHLAEVLAEQRDDGGDPAPR